MRASASVAFWTAISASLSAMDFGSWTLLLRLGLSKHLARDQQGDQTDKNHSVHLQSPFKTERRKPPG